LLVCHPDTPAPGISVRASVSGALKVSFAFEGEVKLPTPATPRFVDGLWRHTCFEVFVARPGMAGYQEFNLSPSGEWAAYGFDGYRAGMTRLSIVPLIEIDRTLNAVIPVESGPMLLGLSAVVEEKGGRLSYWALKHAPGKPDFHHRAAFALALPWT
jgi:hypothetical protein